MIIDLRFGNAARHQMYYDTQRKRGTLKLWSSYSGSILGADRIKQREGFEARSMAHQKETLFHSIQHTEFLIAEEGDIFSILASLVAVLNGHESSFATKEGRKITFYLKKNGSGEKDVITVKIQYGQAGKLTIGEAHKLQAIARDLLRDLGYSDAVISKKLERVTRGSPT